MEDLAKLSVSSTEINHSSLEDGLVPQNSDLHTESTEKGPSLEPRADKEHTSPPGGEDCVATSHQVPSGDQREQEISLSNLNSVEDAAQTIVTDGQPERGLRDRGRRPRGPQYGRWHERAPRGSNQWDGAGSAYHRGGRGHRARGGGFSHHHRGGGPHRGTGKMLHPKTEIELKKERVL